MNAPATTDLTLDELASRVRAVAPDALLVRPRLLRRIIKADCKLPVLGLGVPHATNYLIPRERLLAIAALDELGIDNADKLAEVVILLPQPERYELRAEQVPATLARISGQLLHAVIHRTFRQRRIEGVITAETARQRFTLIGSAAREEIRAVLAQESLLLPTEGDEDLALYEEFAAVFLELSAHAPHRIERWFPALDRLGDVRAALAEDLGGSDLVEQCRLPGAIDEEVPVAPDAEVLARPIAANVPRERLLVEARSDSLRGNLVRSAILRARAGELDAAGATLAELAERLCQVMDLPESEIPKWQEQLRPLAEPAAAGAWSRTARFLYDLQTVCQDREKPAYAVDLIGWAQRGGGQIRRELPHYGEVRSCRRLRRARERVAGLPIAEPARAALDRLLAGAIQRAEADVRTAFRPRLETALEVAGFRPRNHVETLARGKVVSELLELVVERGSFNLGMLRDVIAGNRLKLGDVTASELLTGDALLKANGELAVQLDGVYHRGEFYLRWLQSLSSLTFGTLLGRLLTLWMILPLLGSFLVLKSIEEILSFVIKPPEVHAEQEEAGPPVVQPKHHHHSFGLVNTRNLLSVALFILVAIHSAAVRRLLLRLLWRIGQGLHAVFIGLPLAVLRFPPLQWFLRSRFYVFCYLYVIRPLVVALLLGGVVWLCGSGGETSLIVAAGTFVVSTVLLNSRLGRWMEEWLGDGLHRTWTLLRNDLLLGLLQGILAFFRRTVEEVDRLFYTVDEWLRSREGDRQGTIAIKVVLSTLWWCVTFVFRFIFIVLLEPQINPIKHFPVVTVGHKVLLLAVEPTARAVSASFGLDIYTAGSLVVAIFSLIPGVFGFLAWELQANWRLYRANQSPTLDPMRVGGHGETMRGLFRPGFHSGTVPKLFARLRHLPERAESRRLRRLRDALHHCKAAITAFVQRDLIDALQGTGLWSERMQLRISRVHLDTRRVRIALAVEGREGEAVLSFEQCGPYLVFDVLEKGWSAWLPEILEPLWRDALMGFCKHAGVQLTPEQLSAALPGATWRIEKGRLTTISDRLEPALYDLEAETTLTPTDRQGFAYTRWPALERALVRFDAHPIEWQAWVEIWQQAKKGHKPSTLLTSVPFPA